METYDIAHYLTDQSQFAIREFEEALNHSTLRYSMRHIVLTGIDSQENMMNALRKSMKICALAGVNSKHHFKQIYVFDAATGVVHADWLMSKKGFNLMIMQAPSLNEPIARWLWELVNFDH
jgi:hypothetical protein